MNIKDLLNRIDKIVPFSLSEVWDNTGLIVGDNEMPVYDICLTLDATPEVIDQAVNAECNVIITHHPLIFTPISNVDTSSFTGSVIKKAIKTDTAIISLHTNWDKSGLNNTLASALKLNDIRTLQPQKKEEDRIGVIGELPQKKNPDSFMRIVKDAWNLSHIIYYGAKGIKQISSVAICGGASSEFWIDALHEEADVYITAEVKYHHRLAAAYNGLSVMQADHYEMENFSLLSLAKALKKITKNNIRIITPNIEIKTLISDANHGGWPSVGSIE